MTTLASCALLVDGSTTWHKPLYTALARDGFGSPDTKPLWELAQRFGADLVLHGHDHSYQRFEPQDANGRADPNGLREFIVGTGGVDLRPNLAQVPNLAVANGDTFGVLKLTLRPSGYDWQFVPEVGNGNGTFTDAGSATCSKSRHGQDEQRQQER
ncbi:hypothetical protein HC028_18765 [Planosporangium flavigriseum]|uniref:Calcineurin-like phosphoesterase n=1 Tax=Planosporangium flavigriseum TaxID=373681 RepID=A0A8J3LHG8_9ACTN|nr:hypothetical protein [Planosporangium flavigriseum]NJC66532.1 hypothetical protein [Planosporangium flavigriseum]GIG73403.1 hypothetical protein Pfl04_18070 [Planosporangium flavigriseum]